MANAKRCDRCRKFYSNDEKTFKINDRRVGGVTVYGFYNAITNMDLCDDCARDLWHFLCNEQED